MAIENGFNAFSVPGSSTQDEIAQLYRDVLGREADAEGLNYWTQQAQSGALDIAGVRSNLETSPEAVLRSAYEHELGRKADEEGLAYWQDQIAKGNLTPEQAVQSIDASAESQGKINLYNDLLSKGYTLDQMAQAVGNQYTIDDIQNWAINNQLQLPTQADPNAFSLEKFMVDQLKQSGGTVSNLQDFQMPTVAAPSAVAALAQARGYTPETIAGQDMSKYMNPYTQQVIDQSMADLERQRQMQTNNLGFSATQAGAFGGSRHGVAEALTNEGFARQGGQLAANLRQAGYGQALATAGQDVGMMNQAGQFGAGAANQAALANAAAQTGVSQFNANTNLAAQQANQNAALSGAGMQLQAANAGANMANLGFGWQNTLNTNLFNQGLAQQQMNQQLINNAMNQYNAWSGYGANSLGMVPGATGAFGNMGTTSEGYSPGLTDLIGLGIGTAKYWPF